MHIRSTLESIGVKPSKRFGQNFLIHDHHSRTIAAFAKLQKGERIIEIGPGLGALTGELLKITNDYYCVELEPAFISYLKRRFPQISEERFICSDIRKIDPAQYIKNGERLVVVSNLPYSVSSDVLLWVFEHRMAIKSVSLLLQREFAERVAEPPGSKKYGILSVYAAMYSSTFLGSIIPGTAFHPPVDVDSRLLRIELLEQPRFQVKDEKLFRKVVRTSFSQRRKTLANSLGKSSFFNSREGAKNVFEELEIDPSRRPETLSAEDYANISNRIS